MGLNNRAPLRRVLLVGLVAAAALVLSGCSAEGKDEIQRLAMPAPRTVEGQHTYDLWHWSWLAAIIVGVIVWGLIGYVVIRFRRRSDDEVPVQTRYNLPIEVFYTIAPVMMVVVLFFFTIKVQEEVLPASEQNISAASNKSETQILVVGQRWSWAFNYRDAVDGQTVYDVGTTADFPTLWLPVDQKVHFELYSPDVIHDFWVPSFLFKMDVVPGHPNNFSLTPNRKGFYAGKCAELCGTYHSRMLFNVKVTSRAEYDRHLQSLKDAGNVGTVRGNELNRVQSGLDQPGDGSSSE